MEALFGSLGLYGFIIIYTNLEPFCE